MPLTEDGKLTRFGRWSEEDRARVVEMRIRTGGNSTMISRETGVPQPTVWRWLMEAGEEPEANPLIRRGWQSIVLRAQGKLGRYLDILDDADDAVIMKEAFPLNALAGTGTDKLLKERAVEKPPEDHRQLVIVLPGMPVEPLTIDVPSE